MGNCGRSNCTGYSEIRYFNAAVAANQDVMRFNITVNNLILMCMVKRIANLGSNPDRFVYLERCPFFYNFIKVLAFNILHNDIMDILFLTHIVDTDYIRMR
ncbi:hypothetical protein D3C74_338690 [compost metagenome]